MAHHTSYADRCLHLILFGILLCSHKVTGHKPVVIVHGVMDKNGSLNFMAERIREAHPGTNVTIVDLFHGVHSLTPMWRQVNVMGRIIEEISRENPGGIHLIGYSQGGLICRAVIQSNANISVDSFVSLSSPQAGQYGDAFLHLIFPNIVKEAVYRFFYSAAGQRVSVANYWNDPYHQKLYLQHSNFLPYVNNEIISKKSATYRSNFLRIKRLVLIGGPDDGVITPWQSSQFGYYNHDDQLVLPMKFRRIYKKDLFGLKTLDKDGKLRAFTVPGVPHTQWHHRTDVIDDFILPFLN